jgi:hypothetical protein
VRLVTPRLGAAAAVLASLAFASFGAYAQESVTLMPTQARTIALSRCGGAALSTSEANCKGFDAREVRETPDIFVLGFENNAELSEKHVMQVVVSFDLSQVNIPSDSEVTSSALGYSENSTTRRSAAGDSDYGVLQSCNSKLGVPSTEWNGSVNALLATRPALTAGVTPATTGGYGYWYVTPQIKDWLAAGQKKATFVMQADDESPNIQAQSMCLSYISDLHLGVDTAPKE